MYPSVNLFITQVDLYFASLIVSILTFLSVKWKFDLRGLVSKNYKSLAYILDFNYIIDLNWTFGSQMASKPVV